MSRILEYYINKYDENLTVAQLKKAIEQDEISAKQIETEKINKVKEDFKDVYLKRIYDCNLFGKTLQVFHIEEVTDSTKCTDYSLSYFVSGTKIAFSPQDINLRKLKEKNTLDIISEKDLREMTSITEDGYYYYKTKYNEIRRQLDNLIGL
jgi:hypothetical protein